MIRKCYRNWTLMTLLWTLSGGPSRAITSINTGVANKSVVFFYQADSNGRVLTGKEYATGFLIVIPSKTNPNVKYPVLITARHVVDPIWLGCESTNPTKLFVRVNKKQYDPAKDSTGVDYIPIDLTKDGSPNWAKSDDDAVDVAVLHPPPELMTSDEDVEYINFNNFGSPEEIAKLGIGSQIASTGLVPGIEGARRNYPVFKFGKIASMPDEPISFACKQNSIPHALKIWWLDAILVPGTSGSPIYFDPLFPPGAAVTAGEPRAMIIGLQSLGGEALSGMTPANYIIDVLKRVLPADADFSFGASSSQK